MSILWDNSSFTILWFNIFMDPLLPRVCIMEKEVSTLHVLYHNDYHIVQNFDGGRGGGEFDVFDAFQLDHQNLTCQIV